MGRLVGFRMFRLLSIFLFLLLTVTHPVAAGILLVAMLVMFVALGAANQALAGSNRQ